MAARLVRPWAPCVVIARMKLKFCPHAGIIDDDMSASEADRRPDSQDTLATSLLRCENPLADAIPSMGCDALMRDALTRPAMPLECMQQTKQAEHVKTLPSFGHSSCL